METGYASHCQPECRDIGGGNLDKSGFNLGCGNFQIGYCLGIHPVETATQLQHRVIAALANISDYLKHDLLNFPTGLFSARKNSGKFLIKTGIVDI
jgi:hypothetical protein